MATTYDIGVTQRLIQLRDKIEKNIATVDEYNEYEQLIVGSGRYTHDEVLQRLRNYGFNSWDEYYKARQTKLYNNTEKTNTEGAILGTILGLALAVIIISKLTSLTSK